MKGLHSVWHIVAAGLTALGLTNAVALPPDDLPKTPRASVVEALAALRVASKAHPEIAADLDRSQQSVSIVFVPGILGSSLEDAQGQGWGVSSPAYIATHLKDFMQGMALDPQLIDETQPSQVKTKVVTSVGGINFYGTAVTTMRSKASSLHIPFETCGYDWRRDIRAGAADLEKCLTDTFHGQTRDIIIIAHSMGGLVTWQWAMNHFNGKYSKKLNLLQTVILGSPLEGSCEVLRMIEKGYVQPDENSHIIPLNARPNTKEWLVQAFDQLSNAVNSDLTQGIRPVVLTWPGAIELTPAPTTDLAAPNCEHVPRTPSDLSDKAIVSYYDIAFWSLPVGKELLNPYQAPASLDKVLAKAAEFRSGFSPQPLPVPTWLYLSEAWLVPNLMATITENDQVHLAKTWATTKGDGRVPETSAQVASSQTVYFSWTLGVPSVHGDLPGDPTFISNYFDDRLPDFLHAHLLSTVVREVSTHPDWIDAYLSAGGGLLDESDVRKKFDPSLHATPSIETADALTSIEGFNGALCKRITCATTYLGGRDLIKRVSGTLAAERLNTAVVQWGRVSKAIGKGDARFSYAEGNKGMAQAQMGDWSSAVLSLKNSHDRLDALPDESTEAGQGAQDQFKLAVTANYAKSLYENGYCKDASPLLKATTGYWSFSSDVLKKPCDDLPSGLKYCFDTDDFCTAP